MIIALLSWYDEKPDWLFHLGYSLQNMGVRHLVALDGAYRRLEGGKNCSLDEQRRSIADGATAGGCGVTVSKPDSPWDSEMQKRTALFEYGKRALADYGRAPSADNHDDWFLIIDADEYVHHAPDDLQQQLREASENNFFAVEGRVFTPRPDNKPWHPESWASYRKMFRALPDLHVVGRHWQYVAQGQILWGPPSMGPAPAVEIPDLQIVHRLRPHDKRRIQQLEYYKSRDKAGDEFDICDVENCESKATQLFEDHTRTCRIHGHDHGLRTGTKSSSFL